MRRRKLVIRIVMVALLGLFLASFVTISRRTYTCLACRLTRVDSTCLGVTRSSSYENECSLWYAAHVEPSHDHSWERGTCVYTRNVLGFPVSVGCRPGHYPIWLLHPSSQKKVYERFKDPLQAKALFESLADAKSSVDRLDRDDDDRGHLTVDAIEAWELEGFPGTWPEWWAVWYANHVEEHRERLAWLNSDARMNFQDWRNEQQAKQARERPAGPIDQAKEK